MKRYDVLEYTFIEDSAMKTVRAGELSRILVVDTFNNNQAVAVFPIKQSKRAGGNLEYFGVEINNASLARDMAARLCTQMNRESGYLIRQSE